MVTFIKSLLYLSRVCYIYQCNINHCYIHQECVTFIRSYQCLHSKCFIYQQFVTLNYIRSLFYTYEGFVTFIRTLWNFIMIYSNPERDFQILATPHIHSGVVRSNLKEELPVCCKQPPGHGGWPKGVKKKKKICLVNIKKFPFPIFFAPFQLHSPYENLIQNEAKISLILI